MFLYLCHRKDPTLKGVNITPPQKFEHESDEYWPTSQIVRKCNIIKTSQQFHHNAKVFSTQHNLLSLLVCLS
jgi:hypothetical protein